MRRIRYSVAMSLDGYIAGPKGEFDWIKTDPDFDFTAVFKQFDTIVAGRGTFEPMAAAGGGLVGDVGDVPGQRRLVGVRLGRGVVLVGQRVLLGDRALFLFLIPTLPRSAKSRYVKRR